MQGKYEYQNNDVMKSTGQFATMPTVEPKSPSIFEQLGQLDKLSSEIKARAEQIRALVGPSADVGKTEGKEIGPANNVSSNLYFLNSRLHDINAILSDALYVLVSK